MVQQMHECLVPSLPIVALLFLHVQDVGLVAPRPGCLHALLLQGPEKGNALLYIYHAVLRAVVEEDFCSQGIDVVGGVVEGLPANWEICMAAIMVDGEGIVWIEAGVVVSGNADGVREGLRQCLCYEHGSPSPGGYAQEDVVGSGWKGTKTGLEMRNKGIGEPAQKQAAAIIGAGFGIESPGVDAFPRFGNEDAIPHSRGRVEKGGVVGRIGADHVPAC